VAERFALTLADPPLLDVQLELPPIPGALARRAHQPRRRDEVTP
jgi:hypothetical protein